MEEHVRESPVQAPEHEEIRLFDGEMQGKGGFSPLLLVKPLGVEDRPVEVEERGPYSRFSPPRISSMIPSSRASSGER